MNRSFNVAFAAAIVAFAVVTLPGCFGTTAHAQRLPFARSEIRDLSFLGEVIVPTGTMFEDTVIGGLSGIDYDARNDTYYAISDDRSQFDPARFYGLTIDLADGSLDDGDIEFQSVTTLRQADGSEYPALSLDPEGIALRWGLVFISSEGDANAGIAPFVNAYSRDGGQVFELPVPEAYLPTETSGIRNNLAFESLTFARRGRELVTATENALIQDGPAASLTDSSPARILVYRHGRPVREYRYDVEPIADEPVPAGSFATNGLVELLAVDDRGTFLALERSFSVGVGNSVSLYLIRLNSRSRIRPWQSITDVEPLEKELVFDFAELGITIDNLEAMTFGPTLEDGRRTLIVASDNNFSDGQFTQFLAFAIDEGRACWWRH